MLSVSADVTLEATGALTPVVITASATDIVDGDVMPMSDVAVQDAYTVGVHTITWTATDENGNEAEPVTQTITITDNTVHD